MNLATKITVARIFLIFPAAILYVLAFFLPYQKEFLIACCVTFSVLCATDFVDGTIARKTKTVSNLGKFLDPLADKVVIVIMLVLMMWTAKDVFDVAYPYAALVFSLLSGLVISRELIIGIFRTIAVERRVVLAADVFGKVKTIFLDVAVAVAILAPIGKFYNFAGQIIFYVGAILAIVSGIHYIIKNRNVFSEIKEELDGIQKSKFNVKSDKYPPKFFDVLQYAMEGNVLSFDSVKKKFKIGSITTNNIFSKMEELGFTEKTEDGIKAAITEKEFNDLLSDARGE